MTSTAAPRVSQEDRQSSDAGFSLIELLVVVVILGILAAIIVPVLLNQRTQAQDTAATSDLINTRTAVVAYSVDNDGDYPPPNADLAAYGAVRSTAAVPTIVVAGADFCIEVVSDSSTPLFVTRDGGVQVGTCAALAPPTPDAAPESVVEPSPEPVVEPAPEPVVEPSPESVVEPSPEPPPVIDSPLGRRR